MSSQFRATALIFACSAIALGLIASHPAAAAAANPTPPTIVTLDCNVVPTQRALAIVITNPYSPRGNNFGVPLGSTLFLAQGSFSPRRAYKHISVAALSPGGYVMLPTPVANWVAGACSAWIQLRQQSPTVRTID
jgi:hypothetical protein